MVKVAIDFEKLLFNVRLMMQSAGNKRLIPVIKADGYGHGAARIGRFLADKGFQKFAVYDYNEASELRAAGLTGELLIFCPLEKGQLTDILNQKFIPTLFSAEEMKRLDGLARKKNQQVRVALNVSTGMNIFSVHPNQYLQLLETLKECKNLILSDVYTHLTDSEIEDTHYSLGQVEIFRLLTQGLPVGVSRHLLNTAGIFRLGTLEFDSVRPGAGLYGYCPAGENFGLQPIMKVSATFSMIRQLYPGQTIGYNRTFRTPRATHLGVVSLGYGKGLGRGGRQGLEVLVKGRRYPVVGRINMDKVAVDLGPIVEDGIENEEVVLLGQQGSDSISAQEIGVKTDRIFYEVLCQLCPKVQRVYLNG